MTPMDREAAREALAGLIPSNLNLDNPNVSDDAIVPLDVPVGDLRRARSAYEALGAAPGGDCWRPIESAPKDGTRVLLWVNGPFEPKSIIGRWDDDRYATKPRPYWTTDDERIAGIVSRRKHQPTHWLPLPSAPAAPDGEESK